VLLHHQGSHRSYQSLPSIDSLGAPFQKRPRHLREQGVAQHVLFALGKITNLSPGFLQCWRDQIGGTARDRFLVTDRLLLDLRLDGCRRPTIVATDVVLDLRRDDLVSLSQYHVEGRLGAHNLAAGRNQGWKTQLLPHPRHFLQHFVIPILCPLLPKL
jgi:hypothetical protein